MRSYFAPLTLAALFPLSFSLALPASAQALSAESATATAAPASTDATTVQSRSQPLALALTLAQAHRLALAHNPDLAHARLELQAMEGAEIQAGARPNPELGLLVEDTRSATRTTTLQLTQAIELGNKRGARLSAAARTREQAAVALQAKQAELQAGVASAFFELLGAQEHLRLSQLSLELAARSSMIAGKRLQAGKVPPLEQAKAQVAEAGARSELAQAQSDLLLTRQRLLALLGQPKLGFEQVDGNAEMLPSLPADQRVGELIVQAPAIRLAQLDIARRQAMSAGERARRIPDLTVTLGAKRDAELGRTQAVMGLSIPLPLLDSNQGNLMEALRREDQARELAGAASLKLQTEVSQALERLRLSRQQVQMLRAEVLPVAQTAYESAVKGYELGKFAFLDVLDAQRSLFQLRQQTLRHTADAWRASAELDRLLGQDLQQARPSQE